jgi:hypothetical protein
MRDYLSKWFSLHILCLVVLSCVLRGVCRTARPSFYCNVIDVQLSNDREEERFSCLALHDWSKGGVLMLIEGVAEIILAFIIAFVSTSF